MDFEIDAATNEEQKVINETTANFITGAAMVGEMVGQGKVAGSRLMSRALSTGVATAAAALADKAEETGRKPSDATGGSSTSTSTSAGESSSVGNRLMSSASAAAAYFSESPTKPPGSEATETGHEKSGTKAAKARRDGGDEASPTNSGTLPRKKTKKTLFRVKGGEAKQQAASGGASSALPRGAT